MAVPCLDCATPTPRGPRCRRCAAPIQAAKAARRPARRGQAAKAANARLIADHVARFGWRCPGIQPGQPEAHAPHPCTDLVADHTPAVAETGDEHGPRRVLCRRANSALGAQLATQRRRDRAG